MTVDVVFVAGVHGVGKGTFCNRIGELIQVKSFSASDLIKGEKNRPVDEAKYVREPGENQGHLIKALNRLGNVGVVLLDGHFCLHLPGGIYFVPEETFASMNLRAVVLLTGSVDFIHSNLVGRDGLTLSKDEIASLQIEEVSQARSICNELDVELIEIDSRESEGVFSHVVSLLTQ